MDLVTRYAIMHAFIFICFGSYTLDASAAWFDITFFQASAAQFDITFFQAISQEHFGLFGSSRLRRAWVNTVLSVHPSTFFYSYYKVTVRTISYLIDFQRHISSRQTDVLQTLDETTDNKLQLNRNIDQVINEVNDYVNNYAMVTTPTPTPNHHPAPAHTHTTSGTSLSICQTSVFFSDSARNLGVFSFLFSPHINTARK